MTEIQTPSAHVQSVEVARASVWFRTNAVMIAAVALIGISLWWKAILLSHSFFRLDDFFYLERASQSGFTWHYLTWVDAGHLTPLGSAIAWVLVKISPADWTLTSAVTLALLAITCLALLRMLRTFFGNHPGILVLLGIYVLSPLSLSGLTWWTVTLELLPLQAATFFAVTAHVSYLKTANRKHAVAAIAWMFVAMAASLRGAGVVLLLLAVTSGFFIEGTWPRAFLYTLRRWWRLWLAYLVLAAGYAFFYGAALTSSSISPGRPGSFSGVFGFARTQLGDDFIPGFLGGPWRWIGAGVSAEANPPTALARASWVIVAAVIIISIFYRPKAWRAWAILIGWLVVVDMVPVVLGRASFFPGVVLGLWTRYVWDATGIAALCLGLAFLPLAGQASTHRHGTRYYRPLRTAAACLITAAAIGAVVSFYNYPTDPDAALGRTYVATARIALSQAPNGTVILNDPVPSGVTGGQFIGATAMAQPLLSPLINGLQQVKPRFISRPDGTYGHLMEFDGWGRLVPSVVAGASSLPLAAGKTCWPAHNGTITVKLNSYPQNVRILRLGYISGSHGQLLVKYAGNTLIYNFRRGLQAGFIPVTGSGNTVEIDKVTGRLPCFGDVEAGVLLPSSTGTAIPAAAVSG
ncbi:MAG: hypothetical protein ACTHKL_03355 [Streptosporangiaceae bacterium]